MNRAGPGVARWQDAPTAVLDPRPVGEVLEHWATGRGDHPALVWATDRGLATLSYAHLHEDAVELALRLGALAGRDPVAVAASASVDWLTLEYAAALAGTPLVPINPAFTDEEIDHIVRASEAVAVLADAEHRGAPLLARLPGAHELARWRELPRGRNGLPSVSADDRFLVQFTSGTTGTPKGVMTTNGALAANAVNMAHSSRAADRDAHALNFVPLFHAGGLNIYCNPVLYWGGRVTTTRTFDAAQSLRLLTDPSLGVTITNGVLQMFERIADADGFAQARFPSLRVALFGGFGPSAPQTYAKWFGRGFALQLGYGSTELGPMASMNDNPDEGAIARGEFGRPLPLVELRSIDDDGTALPPGGTGEIQVRGPAVTAGYWRRDGQGRTDDDWFSIGDVGFVDEPGFVHITGRLVDRYRSGGENIYPAEVEAAFLDMPGITELAVVGVPDARWGEVPVACYRVVTGAEVDAGDLERFGREHLASFKVPRRWIAMASLPLTASGKVKKHELRAMLGSPG